MAGAKFQYDENGTTFHCFVLAFMVLIVTPATCLFWPWSSSSSSAASDLSSEEDDFSEEKEDFKSTGARKKKGATKRRCQCDGCLRKAAYLKAKEPRQQVKQRLIKIIILLSWLALFAFAYVVYQENVEAQTTAAAFDPFAILGIDPGASKTDAKKAYHRLSLLYHPDRQETGDERLFMRISKAYRALTDDTARRNWEEFGNPDGPGATSFGIALPAWIVAEENSLLVLLVYVLLLLIGLPLVVRFWWANSSKYGGGFKVLLDTSQLFYFYIHRTPAGMNGARVLKVLSGAFEFSREHNGEVAERESDNWTLPKLIKELVTSGLPSGAHLTAAENGGVNRDPPLCYPYSIKARALLYAHLYRIALPAENASNSKSPLEADQQYLLAKCPYLLQEFVQCTAQLTVLAAAGRLPRSPALETLEAAMKLSASLVQALAIGRSPLLQVPHITEGDLRHFSNRRRRIGGLAALAKMGAESEEGEAERRTMLRGLDDRQYSDVVAFLGRLPELTVEVRAEVLDDGEEGGRVTAGALVTATVTVSRRSMVAVFGEGEEEAEEEELLKNDAPADQKTLNSVEKATEAEVEKVETAKPVTVKPVWSKKPAGKKNAKGHRKGKQPSNGNARGRQNQNRRTTAAAAAPPKAEEEEEEEEELLEDGGNDAGGDLKKDKEEDSDSWEEQQQKESEEGSGGGAQRKKPSKTAELFEAPSRRSHPVHCPLYPAGKQEHWWIYVTDRGGSSSSSAAAQQNTPPRLVTFPLFMTNLVERESVELKFSAPPVPGAYAYTVHVRSDSYVDLDYSTAFRLAVHAAPQPVTEHPQWADVSDSEEEDSEGDEYSSSEDDSDYSGESDDEDDGSSSSSSSENDETTSSNSFSKELDSGESFEL